MIDYIVKETIQTPAIEFYPALGTLLIKGRSISDNPIDFYEPLLDVLDKYKELAPSNTKVDFKLEYFNTTSSKCILSILRKLKTISSDTNKLTLNWFYDEDDEEILEVGQDFNLLANISFNFISVPV